MSEKIKYRPDIDGLRAVAILPVVLFHFYSEYLRGGFVGVDIFFVISGYLITSIVVKDLKENSFSLIHFYQNRILRIFPSLLLVLYSLLFFGKNYLLPDELNLLYKHLFASSTFQINFTLLQENGYFDFESELKPLLHIWSLSIEEQFYILYPAVILIAHYYGFSVIKVVAAIMLGSLCFNVYFILEGSKAIDFFSPLSRFWELSFGGMVAIISNKEFNCTNSINLINEYLEKYKNHLHLICILAISISCILFSANIFYPGFWAVVPVLSAGLILIDGKPTFITKILASAPMVYIGKISYPLYLWHWPIYSIYRIVEGVPGTYVRLGLITFSFAIASVTYHLLELNIKKINRTIATILLISGLIIVVFSGHYLQTSTMSNSDRDKIKFMDYYDNSPPNYKYFNRIDAYKKYREECNFYDLKSSLVGRPTDIPRVEINSDCYIFKPKHTVFIWGDSHAQQLNYGLSKTLPKNYQLNQVASSACPPMISMNSSVPKWCRKSNEFARLTLEREAPDVVILAQKDKHQKVNDLRAVVNFLKSINVSKIILIGPVPQWDPYLYKVVMRKHWGDTPQFSELNLRKEIFNLDKILKREYFDQDNLIYVSAIDYFCNQGKCRIYFGDNLAEGLVTADYGHLTPVASYNFARDVIVPIIISDH